MNLKYSLYEQYRTIATKYGLVDTNGSLSVKKTKDFIEDIEKALVVCKEYLQYRETNTEHVGKVAWHNTDGIVLTSLFKFEADPEGNCRVSEYEIINNRKESKWVKADTLIPYNEQSKILYGDKK